MQLVQRDWDSASNAAFLAAYADEPGAVDFHRGEILAGREMLLQAGALGFVTARIEPDNSLVLTGAAGAPGGFAAVLDVVEFAFPCVCVETFRPGLLRMLKRRGYQLDHVRVFRRV